MIRHMIMFNLKPELEPPEQEWLFGQIRSLATLPMVRGLSLGRLLDAREDWYKARVNTEYGWALSMDFENEDALYAYQKDPKHVEIAQEIRKRATGTRVVDFVGVG
ncbi:MAG TPA: Dabb family protein [Terriglobia bacterium]|nr:Dabb family protein [Terriglobia bacterium]